MQSFLLSWRVPVWRVFAASIGAACLLSLPAIAAGVQLSIPDQIQVSKAELVLGDIVTVQGDDSAKVLRIRQIPLGVAPRVGTPVLLQRTEITRWIRAHLGASAEPLSWSGAQSVKILTKVARVDQQRLYAVARSALQEWLQRFNTDPRGRIELLEQSAADVWLPQADYTYTVRPIADGIEPQKNMELWVEISTEGHFVQLVPVRFLISLFRPVWVSNEPVPAGANLAQSAIELKSMDITLSTHLREIRPPNDAALNDARGVRVRNGLHAGDILTYVNTESYPLVARGDMVVLRSSSGVVQLESRGQALEDGALGQLVHFSSTSAMRPVVARISAPGMAEVE